MVKVPVKLEFETKEFNAVPLSDRAKARLSSGAKTERSAAKSEQKRREANARALSHLLQKKEKAKRASKRVQIARANVNLKKSMMKAEQTEAAAAAAVRRLSLRRSLLEKVDAHNSRVHEVSMRKAQSDVLARTESARKLEERVQGAVARSESFRASKVAKAAESVQKAKDLAHAKKERTQRKSQAIAVKLESAHDRRQKALDARRAKAERSVAQMRALERAREANGAALGTSPQ